MRWLLLLLGVAGAGVGLAIWRRLRCADDRRPVSRRWLRQQDHLTERVEYHGPTIKKWPLNKVVNEHGRFQAERLRRQA